MCPNGLPDNLAEEREENLELLIDQAERTSGIVPFVGAGLSKAYEAPLWNEFLNECAKNVSIQAQKEALAYIRDDKFEEAAERLIQDNRNSFEQTIARKFGDHILRRKPKGFPVVSLLPRLATGPVITTNFDRALEKAFEQAQFGFADHVSGAHETKILEVLRQDARYLLKIHGDWKDREHRILTRSEYETHYGKDGSVDFNKALPQLMQLMLTGRTLLFLGCSLRQDRTLEILKKIIGKLPSVSHFAIVEAPDEDKEAQRRADLADHGIFPIWYAKEDHAEIRAILERLLQHTAKRAAIHVHRKTPMGRLIEHITDVTHWALIQNQPVTLFCRAEDYERVAIKISREADNCLIWTVNGSPIPGEATDADHLTEHDREFEGVSCQVKVRLVIFKKKEKEVYIKAGEPSHAYYDRRQRFEKSVKANGGLLRFTSELLVKSYLGDEDLDIGYVSCEPSEKKVGGVGFQSPFNSGELGKDSPDVKHVTFYPLDFIHGEIFDRPPYKSLYSGIRKRIKMIDNLRRDRNPSGNTLFFRSPEEVPD